MPYSAFEEAPSEKKSEDVGFFESALAGVVNGVVRIPRGFVSLGAEIYDLVGDANTAKEVENWFDNNLALSLVALFLLYTLSYDQCVCPLNHKGTFFKFKSLKYVYFFMY